MTRFRQSPAGPRGPAKHDIRDQIVAAAAQQFRDYGYDKTIISDLAAKLGFSKAYIYKFFPSKQAIGDVIASNVIDGIVGAADAGIVSASSASDKLRHLFRSVTRNSLRLMNDDRHLYDMVALSIVDRWSCSDLLAERIQERLRPIVLEGRRQGEFERKTPLDETCRAIAGALRVHTHPLMLSEHPGSAADAVDEVIGLVLRSLSAHSVEIDAKHS